MSIVRIAVAVMLLAAVGIATLGEAHAYCGAPVALWVSTFGPAPGTAWLVLASVAPPYAITGTGTIAFGASAGQNQLNMAVSAVTAAGAPKYLSAVTTACAACLTTPVTAAPLYACGPIISLGILP